MKVHGAAFIGLKGISGTRPRMAFAVREVFRGALVAVGDDEGAAEAEDGGEGEGEQGGLHFEGWWVGLDRLCVW